MPASAAWTLDAPEPARDLSDAATKLLRAARSLGFEPVGIAPAELPIAERERLAAWTAAGHHGGMRYMSDSTRDRAAPERLLEDARAVLVVGLAYPPRAHPDRLARGHARISTYAQASCDYHRVLSARLTLLEAFFAALLPGAKARRFCDTAPLLERAFARLAGLGFVGKNTTLINRARGSFFFLGGLVLDRPLPPTDPDLVGSCGSCTLCLEACPTSAFPAPYVLDARRCISYLTIEHRGVWAEALRAEVGDHVFGCDVCQAVCPWNRKFAAPSDPELEADPERRAPPLLDLVRRAQQGFKSIARHSPWARPGKRGFLRNLATALGNAGDAECRGVLAELAGHDAPCVSEHAAWALERLEDRLAED